MRRSLTRTLAPIVLLAAALAISGCRDSDDADSFAPVTGPGGPPAVTGGGADLDITNSTPATGNTNISGSGVVVSTSADTLSGTPVTRVQVDATSDGQVRRVLVYFETSGGALRAVSYYWGASNINDNIVWCPSGGCTGVTVNQATREIFFSGTNLDNNDPFAAPTKFATISLGGIQYP